MNKTGLFALTVAVCSLVYTYCITDSIRRTEDLRGEINEAASRSLKLMTEAERSGLSRFVTATQANVTVANAALLQSFTELNKQSLDKYSEKLRATQSAVLAEMETLSEVKSAKEREFKDLPSRVTLRDLNSYYATKFAQAKPYHAVESFTTKIGTLSFSLNDFEFDYFPEKEELVRLRIGKESYEGSFELADAWLDDALSLKIKNGYAIIEDETKLTTYGLAKWKVLQLGDLYCKIYRETTRYKGDTYNTTHQQYKFFVEVGSRLGNEKKRLLDYNQKLGS
jgi:hypothetical protein